MITQKKTMNIIVNPIGYVHSGLKSLSDCPLQENEGAPVAVIRIFDAFQEAMKDVRPGDPLVVLTWLDKGDRSVLTTRPRNDPRAPMTGVFSTRSPDRPNPIGLHFVTVTSVLTTTSIEVSGLEVLDGTPVVDLKVDLGKV
jgi:tRNA-Thr(GGU) m(6)t(6)A37 methyltransferase TsaA